MFNSNSIEKYYSKTVKKLTVDSLNSLQVELLQRYLKTLISLLDVRWVNGTVSIVLTLL